MGNSLEIGTSMYSEVQIGWFLMKTLNKNEFDITDTFWRENKI